jgi:glycosyltransferase involved in cell wall biosynthesis
MKISIITVCYNAAPFIRTCIESVLAQDHPDIEYVIVDGLSKDGTQDIVRSYGSRISRFVSEKDQGLYDAMNKGIALCSGEVIGILNADDLYDSPQVLSKVAALFEESGADTVFANLVYVEEGDLERVVRYFPGKGFHPGWFAWGKMPPHPTFFVRRELYERYGVFDTRFRICADFDLMLRFLHVHKASYAWLPLTTTRMRTGGSSTQGLKSTLTINREMLASCRKHGVRSSLPQIYAKYFGKIFQLIKRPS